MSRWRIVVGMRGDGLRPQYPTFTFAGAARIDKGKFGVFIIFRAPDVVLCLPECSDPAQEVSGS
jgi:hypothetical protein